MAKWQDKKVLEHTWSIYGARVHEIFACIGHNSIAGIIFSTMNGKDLIGILMKVDPMLDPNVQNISQSLQKTIGLYDSNLPDYPDAKIIRFSPDVQGNKRDWEELINAVDAIVPIPVEMKFVMALEGGLNPAAIGAGDLAPEIKFGLVELYEQNMGGYKMFITISQKIAWGIDNLPPEVIYKSAEIFNLDKVKLGVVDLYHKPTPLEKALEDVFALHESTAPKSFPGLVIREVLTNPQSMLSTLLADIIDQVNNGSLHLKHENTEKLTDLSHIHEGILSAKQHSGQFPSHLGKQLSKKFTKKETDAIEAVTKKLETAHYQYHFGVDENKAEQGSLQGHIQRERAAREGFSKPYMPEARERYKIDNQRDRIESHTEKAARDKEQKDKKGGGVLL